VRCSGTFPYARYPRKREACAYRSDGGRVTVLQRCDWISFDKERPLYHANDSFWVFHQVPGDDKVERPIRMASTGAVTTPTISSGLSDQADICSAHPTWRIPTSRPRHRYVSCMEEQKYRGGPVSGKNRTAWGKTLKTDLVEIRGMRNS
jgi:hypothetical protein